MNLRKILSEIKTLSFIVLLIFMLCLAACEAQKEFLVTVNDHVTGKPIDSVQVVFKAGKYGDFNKSGAEGYTDSTGKFRASFMIGCSFGCYDIFMELHKKGYTSMKIAEPKDTSIVTLTRESKE
jgi:hypothetical protein